MNTVNGATTAQDAEGTRHRHCQDVARLLKEYTAVMYGLLHETADLDYQEEKKVPLPWPAFHAIMRYRAIWNEVAAVALFASQMLLHYQLDEAEAAELRLRVTDVEHSIAMMGHVVSGLPDQYARILGGSAPLEDELDTLLQQIRNALQESSSR